jgi:hypothetical protein
MQSQILDNLPILLVCLQTKLEVKFGGYVLLASCSALCNHLSVVAERIERMENMVRIGELNLWIS